MHDRHGHDVAALSVRRGPRVFLYSALYCEALIENERNSGAFHGNGAGGAVGSGDRGKLANFITDKARD
jgi:hypothetical protein